jgi:CBS domain-containing protein
MKVRDVMTSEVATANADTTLEEIATMMKSEDTGAIPVVEEDELLGLITDRDIVIRCVAEGRDPAEVSAEDILSENLEVVDPETDVQEALDIMGRHQIRRLPVVEDGTLVGMVSLGDLAVKQSDEQDTGEALKDVSKGVKGARRAAQPVRTTNTATRNATTNTKGTAKTGITNNLEEEEKRQERVVSIRPDANALPRGQKKPGKRQAS